MFPAPSLFGTTANVPESCLPVQFAATFVPAGAIDTDTAAIVAMHASASFTPLLYRHDAAAEPRHAARRARRRSGARAGLRKPRLSPRRARDDPAAVRGPAVDRLPPDV